MNTLKGMASLAGFNYTQQACCCPERGYKADTVYCIVRASSTTRYIFKDGRTLTVGHKTRYATFPRNSHPVDIASEAMQELREKHPLTINLYVTENK